MSTHAPAPAHILVVDDEPDLRTLYELTLLREGYHVDVAETVADAWKHLQEHRYEVLITDMRLPDGLGIELIQRLRTQQRGERGVVITAYGSAENAVESLKAGAFDYLTKPVDLKQFRTVIASAVQDALTPGSRHRPLPPWPQHHAPPLRPSRERLRCSVWSAARPPYARCANASSRWRVAWPRC